MELRQLEYFVAVAEEANFTRAAERVHVAQPAVSAQIRHLERELGQQLFDRSRRTVRLTAAGEAVLPHARAALAAVTAARTAVEELGELVRGSVVVGTVTAHDFDMAGLLAQFHAAHPLVDITLTTDESDALLDGLHSGRLDAAIVSVGAELPAGLAAEVVTDQRIVAAVAGDHPWHRRRTVALRDLADHLVIALPTGAGIRHQFDQACRGAGVAARVAFEASTPHALAELAERGLESRCCRNRWPSPGPPCTPAHHTRVARPVGVRVAGAGTDESGRQSPDRDDSSPSARRWPA